MFQQRIELEALPAPRPRVCKGHTFMPSDYVQFKRDLALLWRGPRSGSELHIRFEFEPPKLTKKERKERLDGTARHRFKPDIDNLLKAVMDAILDNDQLIWSVQAEKVWAEKSAIIITLE